MSRTVKIWYWLTIIVAAVLFYFSGSGLAAGSGSVAEATIPLWIFLALFLNGLLLSFFIWKKNRNIFS